MLNKILYGILTGFSKLPFRVLYIVSDFMYYVFYYVIPYRKRLVYKNLKASFPEKSPSEIRVIAKRFYRHLSDIMVETLKLHSISEKELSERLNVPEIDDIKENYKKGIQFIAATGHYGNWEWFAATPLLLPYAVTTLYKPLHSKFMDSFLAHTRSRFGVDIVPANEAVRDVSARIKSGKLTMMGFIADQSPKRSMIQYRTTFLNQDTPVFLGIEKIATKYSIGVAFAWLEKKARGYYDVRVKFLTEDASTLTGHEVTDLYLKSIEEVIREKPEYWLWTHKRWKY